MAASIMKPQKTHKIDCRMTGDLWEKVDGFAGASHLSRSQVVERALLAYFGETVQETPPQYGTRSPTASKGKAAA